MIATMTLGFEMSELPPIAQYGIPMLGILLITMSMMMGIRKKRRRPGVSNSARDTVDELRQRQAVRGDLDQLMTEVEQLAKRFGAQLDAKTAHMERLIEEANEKIAELKQLQQTQRNVDALRPPETPEAPQASSLKPQDSSAPKPQAFEPPDPDADLKARVCELSDMGNDPIEIAKQLDEHVGKVELILALRKS